MVSVKTIFFVMIVLFVPLVSAQIVVFESYNTKATLEDNVLHVQRDVRIKNIGQAPIIPGEIHFRVYEHDGGDKRALEVTDFSAKSATGSDLTVRINKRTRETDLSVEIWDPLLPGFHYDFTMEYSMPFDPAGLLFHELTLPREETTIPIQKEKTTLNFKGRYYVTYAPEGEVMKLTGNVVAVNWDENSDHRVVEYSILPLPRLGVRAVNVFWMVIILLLVILSVFSFMKRKPRKPDIQHHYYQQHPVYDQQQYWR